VASIGVLNNALMLILLHHKTLVSGIYNYMWARSLSNLLVCLFGAVYLSLPDQAYEAGYWEIFYRLYVIAFPMRALLSASLYSDILLVLNRLCILKEAGKKTYLSKKAIVLTCYGLALLFFAGCYIGVNIVYKHDDK